MFSRLIISAIIIAVAVSIPLTQISSEHEALFAKFKSDFHKSYFDKAEERFRKSVFVNNLLAINEHNQDSSATYKLAMNKFGDLTIEEFSAKYTGFGGLKSRFIRSQNVKQVLKAQSEPKSVDWVAAGAVTGVKNQGSCGSCWSFSATGAIEGAWFLSKGRLISLSEQQLMDCSWDEGNMACNGGWMDSAFEYVISNGGICSEADYPYQEADSHDCKACSSVAAISSYQDLAETEAALQTALVQQPVSVAIQANQMAFQFYESGVLTGRCGTRLDHGVLAVGYGVWTDGTGYWKVKNSWGEDWGMDGYVLLERGVSQEGGQCGILLAASYPTV